jgi:hypothetical protein
MPVSFADVADDAYNTKSGSLSMYFPGNYTLYGMHIAEASSLVMFKATPDSEPIYMKDDSKSIEVRASFIVDAIKRKAFLELETKPQNNTYDSGFWNTHSFTELSEFHVVIYRPDANPLHQLCFMASYIWESRTCSLEQISYDNIHRFDKLTYHLNLNKDDSKPDNATDLTPESIPESDDSEPDNATELTPESISEPKE